MKKYFIIGLILSGSVVFKVSSKSRSRWQGEGPIENIKS